MGFEGVLDSRIVAPFRELVALESLYLKKGATLKRITDDTVLAGRLPSEALREIDGMVLDATVIERVEKTLAQKIGGFSVVVNGTPGWPEKLRDSRRPTPLIYYRGDLGLIESQSVSVVGSRKASEDGARRARRISRELIERGITVVTGLARGIDTVATQSAISAGGRVVGVIGTPIDETYPKENAQLQEEVASNHLLISQVPFCRYAEEPFKAHRYRFPERNELMAAVSDATVIVEASNTSGTLTQARACLQQGRPLFLMKSLLDNKDITWVDGYIKKSGVSILESVDQIVDALG